MSLCTQGCKFNHRAGGEEGYDKAYMHYMLYVSNYMRSLLRAFDRHKVDSSAVSAPSCHKPIDTQVCIITPIRLVVSL